MGSWATLRLVPEPGFSAGIAARENRAKVVAATSRRHAFALDIGVFKAYTKARQ